MMEHDKSTWGEGPWQHEPDYLHWVDAATDMDCLIVRNCFGALCGYAGVPADHPCYGKDYDEVPVDVPGGCTYADKCQEDGDVCHVPLPGRSDDLWWIGFDCSHSWDYSPAMVARMPGVASFHNVANYKTVDFVRAEVASLAAQLAAMSNGVNPQRPG